MATRAPFQGPASSRETRNSSSLVASWGMEIPRRLPQLWDGHALALVLLRLLSLATICSTVNRLAGAAHLHSASQIDRDPHLIWAE